MPKPRRPRTSEANATLRVTPPVSDDTGAARILDALLAVGRATSSLDLQAALDATATNIVELIGADSGAVLLVAEANDQVLDVRAIVARPNVFPDGYAEAVRRLHLPVGSGLVGWVAKHGESLLVDDDTRDARQEKRRPLPRPEGAWERPPASLLIAPLLLGGNFLGVVQALRLGTHQFQPLHLSIIAMFAQQVSAGLAALRAHEADVRRVRRLTLLHRSSVRLARADAPAAVLRVLARGAHAIAGGGILGVWARASDGRFALGQSHPEHARGELMALWTRQQAGDRHEGDPVLLVPFGDGEHVGVVMVHGAPSTDAVELRRDLETLAAQATSVLARLEALARLHSDATVDELTTVANARAFHRRLAEEVLRANRGGHALSLLVLDSDSLKRLNDGYGHSAGDRHLVSLATILRGSVRGADFVARIGGDEFAVILPETDNAGARATAERVVRALASQPFIAPNGDAVVVTASIGVASALGNIDGARLLGSADAAMYEAKRSGRARVSVAPPPT